jgi:hypothetical protein
LENFNDINDIKAQLDASHFAILCTSFLVAAPMAAKAQDACTIKLDDGRTVPTVDWWLQPWETGILIRRFRQEQSFIRSPSGLRRGGLVQCNRTIGRTLYAVATSSQSDGFETFKTSIAGVGIRIRGGFNSGVGGLNHGMTTVRPISRAS